MSRCNRLCLASAISAAQHFVAMREASEPFDHRLMIQRELQQALVAKIAYQTHGLALVIQIFAMFKRQIEKQAFVFGQASIQPMRHCSGFSSARQSRRWQR